MFVETASIASRIAVSEVPISRSPKKASKLSVGRSKSIRGSAGKAGRPGKSGSVGALKSKGRSSPPMLGSDRLRLGRSGRLGRSSPLRLSEGKAPSPKLSEGSPSEKSKGRVISGRSKPETLPDTTSGRSASSPIPEKRLETPIVASPGLVPSDNSV